MPSDLRGQLQSALGSAYTVERELGGGGMSRVFVAEETALGRKVVVKVLPPETAAGVSIERFKREIMMAARLQHPHIVPLLAAGDASGLAYFTMPFVEGESLHVRLARHGELPVAEAMRVLREIAAALAYAHEHGIVHRDIKPANVLLSGGSAMVTDFGVAKALSASSNAEQSGVTSMGVALGTPAYMAPEQATADPVVDHRADVYAFGVLAYELLTGQPPFTGRTPASLLAAQVNETPEPIGRRRATLPAALSALVMRCLEKRPADRPQSATDIVHALDDITTPSGGMQPTSAVPVVKVAAAPTAGPTRSRFSIGATVAAAVGLMAALFLLWGAWRGGGRTSGADAAQLKTIAVLPFTSGGDTASDYFAEGISEELHGELVRVEGLTVKARSVARLFRDHEDDLAAVAAPLGIGSLVVGSVRRAGSRVRITAELLKVADNSTVWSQRFDAEERDLFALQDSVARAVAGALQARFAVANGSRAGPAGTSNVAAYDLYLRGKFHFEKRGEQSIRRAIAIFQQAVEADPSFARAYAALSNALWILPYWSNSSADSIRAPALAATRRAIALDSTLAEAHLASANPLMDDWPFRWDEAEHSIRRAIEIDPHDANTHQVLGSYLYTVGRTEEGIAELRQATELDPYFANAWNNLGYAQIAARQFDAAIASYRTVLALDAGFDGGHEGLAFAFLLKGRTDSALRELSLRSDSGANTGLLAFRGFMYARVGLRARAESIARDLDQRARSSPDVMGPAGYALLGLGDSARALEWFLRAADAHIRPTRGLGELASLEYDPIRSLPRYPELLRKLNLQNQPIAKLKPSGK